MKDSSDATGAHRKLVTSILARANLVKESCDTPVVVEKAAACALPGVDGSNGRWPIDCEQNILESAVSARIQKAEMSEDMYNAVRNNIKAAAEQFDIFEQVDIAEFAVDTEIHTVKAASEVSAEYALPGFNIFPINSSDEVSRSAVKFAGARDMYPLPVRRQVAENLLKAAAKHNVVLPEDVEEKVRNSAAIGIGIPAKIARQLVARAEKVARFHTSGASSLYGAAVMVAQYGGDDLKGLCEKSAALMDRIDKTFRLEASYGQDIQMPEDACFPLTMQKAASVLKSVIQVGKDVYMRDDVAKVPARIMAILGDDVPAKVANESHFIDPDKLDALPQKSAAPSVVSTVLRGFGIRSLGNKVPEIGTIGVNELSNWARLASTRHSNVNVEGGEMTFKFEHAQKAV